MVIVNVEAAIYREDKWLVIERSSKEEHAAGTISLVGGKVDREGHAMDILERTVRREIFEEVAIEVENRIHYVHSSSFVTDDGHHVINIVFLCKYAGGEAIRKSPEEVGEVMWLPYDEIVNLAKTPPWTKESLSRSQMLRAQLGG